MSFLSGENWIPFCDEAYWVPGRAMNPAPIEGRDGSLIYCHTDRIWELFRALRMRPGRFGVVTAESDHSVTAQMFAARPWNVVEWFSVNALAPDPRCHVLPIGLANESCSRTIKPEQLREAVTPLPERPLWLYVNHRVETNPTVRQRVYDHFEIGAREGWVTLRQPSPVGETEDYLNELRRHRFICAPPGNGVDTHRMWEALYSGTIPIVLRSKVTETFADLPIVIVNDYSAVNLPFLKSQLERILSREWNREKLGLDFWNHELQFARTRIQRTSRLNLLTQWLGRKAGKL